MNVNACCLKQHRTSQQGPRSSLLCESPINNMGPTFLYRLLQKAWLETRLCRCRQITVGKEPAVSLVSSLMKCSFRERSWQDRAWHPWGHSLSPLSRCMALPRSSGPHTAPCPASALQEGLIDQLHKYRFFVLSRLLMTGFNFLTEIWSLSTCEQKGQNNSCAALKFDV